MNKTRAPAKEDADFKILLFNSTEKVIDTFIGEELVQLALN